ncbi:ankyrin repeat domain-containing protein [Candidimonas sp. SYP-B2681]|uniref:ankyrin repeat domain-containing protein n=1 Tax=Candidimonas sp. SYP-B2681 TaxID=2497686 RepID=UPI000F85F5E1|nr:ankyrin repeat domain-containing protein [Candidimonas sp. SYP-B2681]RTZ47972.1 ankyrin repeat domain-containing protein [Candidimonas sp. SYP-B2681]
MKSLSDGLSRRSRLSVAFAAIVLSISAFAAPPSDWWVHIANDQAKNVQTMLTRGVDPNELSAKGQPAIMQAIRDGAWNVYDVLAANPKTALNAININRETPLMYLAVLGETKRSEDLIRRGAMVNRLGWTPLHYAASTGKVDTAKMLIAHKAIIDAPAPDGTTALMMAAHSGNEAMVQLLLNHGAEVTTQNLQKLDAADWARNNKHEALAAKLDALTNKVLQQRAAIRQQNSVHAARPAHEGVDARQGATQTQGTTDVKAVDLNDLDADASKPPKASKPSSNSSGTKSTPYFDLERFNDKPAD